eukprot:2698907-Pleurochrysis_carterae.AAC.1
MVGVTQLLDLEEDQEDEEGEEEGGAADDGSRCNGESVDVRGHIGLDLVSGRSPELLGTIWTPTENHPKIMSMLRLRQPED